MPLLAFIVTILAFDRNKRWILGMAATIKNVLVS